MQKKWFRKAGHRVKNRKTNRWKRLPAFLLAVGMVIFTAGCTEKEDTQLLHDDFYEYVNQELLDEVELGGADAYWDWFGEAGAKASHELEALIAELAEDGKTYEKGTSQQKIKDLYECISDTDNREQTGLGPLRPYFDRIRNAADLPEYLDAVAGLSVEYGFSSIFGGYGVMQDKADSGEYAVYMVPADTLIGKSYVEGEDTQEYVAFYHDYIRDMFVEFGMTEAEAAASADSVEGLLREICGSTLTEEQMYDPSLTYNVFTEQGLQELYTNVDIPNMLETMKISGQEKYIVMDLKQAKKINELLTEENLQALKDYSTFVLLNDISEYCTPAYARLQRNMENALYGITEDISEERIWEDLVQELLPWDFGMLYVEEHFSAEDKEMVEEMIAKILEQYEDIINRQEWMSQETRQKAVRKLETMAVKIGYPDQWPIERDMMQVIPVSEGGSLLANFMTYMNVYAEDQLSRLGTKVDRSEWIEAPQTVNAMYDPLNNEIIFPAGILQAPFYDKENSSGANWGGIGFVIAHEVSHAFDSSGALYDEYGNYNEWWTDEEFDRYAELSEAIAEYYNGYEMNGLSVDGNLTLMENIADLGAMTCISTILDGNKKELEDAFRQTAYIWASKSTDSYQLYLLSVDTHAPNKVRTNGVLSSCDAFYEVYDIRKPDGMYVEPEARVGIWE